MPDRTRRLAATLGFSPAIIHYGLMTMSSITTVGAFDAVGAILVVALMIAPAAAAYLLTTDLKRMLWLSVLFGVFSAISGYWIAHWLDASIAGSITTMLGVLFLVVYLFAPAKGIIAVLYREKQQRTEVENLNGYIIRKSVELGVGSAPANEELLERIQEIQNTYL